MKDGVAQQIAEPQRIYAEPANLDVARFMGYRNLVALNVRSAGGGSAQLAGSGLALTARAMQPLAGGQAMLAIRPEEFDLVSSPPFWRRRKASSRTP